MVTTLLLVAGLPLPATAQTPLARMVDGVEVGGFAQVDYLRRQISEDELSDGTGEPLNEDRFLVRRVRLRVNREWRYVGVRSTTELFSDGSTVRPVAFDVHAMLPGKAGEPPLLKARAGLFPVPFTYESFEQNADDRFFGERTLFASGVVPGRFDLGAALSGHIWAVDWIVAVQNGEPVGTGAYAYADPNGAKDVSGRVRVSGDVVGSVRAALGSSVIRGTGFSPGTPPSKDTFEWRDLNEDGRVIQAELLPIPGSAGRPSQNFERWGVGGDLQLWAELPHLGELFVYGEVVLAVNLDRGVAPADPVLLGRDQRSVGFMAAAVQQLTKHATIGGRFEQYEPNVDALELFDGITVVTRRRFRTWTVGVSGNADLPGPARARLLAELELQENSLGRDNAGRPANLDNDTLRFRAEVAF
ncbi:MAG: hypothetical protein KTR31_39515 [Myxococcales bacterium]|nr:hypothetical protein [Myxococcales bacterium]